MEVQGLAVNKVPVERLHHCNPTRRFSGRVLSSMALRRWHCVDGTASMALRRWHCVDGIASMRRVAVVRCGRLLNKNRSWELRSVSCRRDRCQDRVTVKTSWPEKLSYPLAVRCKWHPGAANYLGVMRMAVGIRGRRVLSECWRRSHP